MWPGEQEVGFFLPYALEALFSLGAAGKKGLRSVS
jgi:hypothetical protein